MICIFFPSSCFTLSTGPSCCLLLLFPHDCLSLPSCCLSLSAFSILDPFLLLSEGNPSTCEALLLTVGEVLAHPWSQRVSESTMLLLNNPCDGRQEIRHPNKIEVSSFQNGRRSDKRCLCHSQSARAFASLFCSFCQTSSTGNQSQTSSITDHCFASQHLEWSSQDLGRSSIHTGTQKSLGLTGECQRASQFDHAQHQCLLSLASTSSLAVHRL